MHSTLPHYVQLKMGLHVKMVDAQLRRTSFAKGKWKKKNLAQVLTLNKNVQFQKISILPPKKVNENSKGDGVAEKKISKKSMELNWNFWRGETNQKTFHGGGGGVWICPGTTQ